MLDHSPWDMNDAVSHTESSTAKISSESGKLLPSSTTLWSPLIKEKPSDAIKRKDNYQGDLSPTTQYRPFSTHKNIHNPWENTVPEIRDLILKYYMLWIALNLQGFNLQGGVGSTYLKRPTQKKKRKLWLHTEDTFGLQISTSMLRLDIQVVNNNARYRVFVSETEKTKSH